MDLLQGQYRSQVTCPQCDRVSVTFDPFMYISLPIQPVIKRAATMPTRFISNYGASSLSPSYRPSSSSSSLFDSTTKFNFQSPTSSSATRPNPLYGPSSPTDNFLEKQTFTVHFVPIDLSSGMVANRNLLKIMKREGLTLCCIVVRR